MPLTGGTTVPPRQRPPPGQRYPHTLSRLVYCQVLRWVFVADTAQRGWGRVETLIRGSPQPQTLQQADGWGVVLRRRPGRVSSAPRRHAPASRPSPATFPPGAGVGGWGAVIRTKASFGIDHADFRRPISASKSPSAGLRYTAKDGDRIIGRVYRPPQHGMVLAMNAVRSSTVRL
jgi:hypothetical protein